MSSLTHFDGDGKIPELPPSSRGLGRSPFKAKTGVRIPVGAQVFENRSTDELERFLLLIQFEYRRKMVEFGLDI